MDFLDPSELCPNDPAQGERVKVAVHALMLNPNDFQARLLLIQYAFGINALNFIGKYPVFDEIRNRDRELFELANQVAMAFCCYKLARSIYKYDRYKHSLRSFVWLVYQYAKDTVRGYAKSAPGAHTALDPDNPRMAREFEAYLNSDAREALAYHMGTQWAEAVRSALGKHTEDFGAPASIVKTRQVGGEIKVIASPDGSQRRVKKGHHEEQLTYIALDISPEECERALAALAAHHAPLYSETATKRRPALSAAEFDCFKRFYLENSKNSTGNQAVNNEVNLAIGRLYLCEQMSLAGILETLGPEYPEQAVVEPDDPAGKVQPEWLTPIKVRSRVYQNLIPMFREFMKERDSCISKEEPSTPSEATEGSSACST
ncbi:MAG: hypothetical protein GX418_00315 [Clostridiales bacterium]|nr:hypothetical protein [Clostridiales bacterium]